MSTLRKFLLILPLALFFSAIGSAQTGAFEGTVKGPDGKTLQGAVGGAAAAALIAIMVPRRLVPGPAIEEPSQAVL